MEHKLSVGETLGEAFSIYTDRAGLLIPVGFWIFLVSDLAEWLVGEAGVIATALGLVVGIFYQGIVISLMRDLRAGQREISVRELMLGVFPVLPALLGAFVLLFLGFLSGWILLFVPGLYLLTIWAVVPQAIVIERLGVFAAFGRSRQLVRGSGWRVFGLVILAVVISFGATVAFALLLISAIDGELIRSVLNAIFSAVIAPLTGLITSVLYFRLIEIQQQRPAKPAAEDLPPRLPA